MESLPDAALRLSCPQPLPDATLCLPYWEMLPCLQLLPDSPSHRHFRWQLLPDAAAAASAGASPAQQLRTAATRGAVTSSAQTSASLHPPAALRLRVLPFTRAWTPTVCAEEFPTPLEMSLHGLHMSTGLLLLRHSKSIGPSAPIAYATSVSSPDEAVAWPGAAFLQITARTNPCSRHLWGTLARAVASICAHRAR